MKSFKELAQDIVNRMEEDAPVNSIAGGGVDMAPNAAVSHSPKNDKKEKNSKRPLLQYWSTSHGPVEQIENRSSGTRRCHGKIKLWNISDA